MSGEDDTGQDRYRQVRNVEKVPRVDPGVALRYGFGLLGYIALYHILAGLFFFARNLLRDSGVYSIVVPGLGLAGVLIYIAGTFGILYKVVADGVAVGSTEARAYEAPLGTDDEGENGDEDVTQGEDTG